jgi:hypothetical protein
VSAGRVWAAGVSPAGFSPANFSPAGFSAARVARAGAVATGVSAGEVSAGEVSACEVSAGEVSAGEVSAGEVSAGEVSAGEVSAAAVVSAGNSTVGTGLPGGCVPGEDFDASDWFCELVSAVGFSPSAATRVLAWGEFSAGPLTGVMASFDSVSAVAFVVVSVGCLLAVDGLFRPNGLRNQREKPVGLSSAPMAKPPEGAKLAARKRLRMVRRIAWILPKNGLAPLDGDPFDGANLAVCSDRSGALGILRRNRAFFTEFVDLVTCPITALEEPTAAKGNARGWTNYGVAMSSRARSGASRFSSSPNSR